MIDYGDEWQEAWDQHVAEWQPPPKAGEYVEAYVLDRFKRLKTTREGSYSSETKDIFCRDEYRMFAGFEKADFHLHSCRIADRYLHRKSGDYRYIAEIMERVEYVSAEGYPEVCREYLREVLFDVPRDCFFIEDSYYSRDHAQPWSFRHDLRIPDRILPDAWIDNLEE